MLLMLAGAADDPQALPAFALVPALRLHPFAVTGCQG